MNAELDGERMTDEEILDVCFLFIMAGLDTVTASLGCSMAYLAQHPEQRDEIVADPSLIPGAVEELLRWEGTCPARRACSSQDIEMNGCPFTQGHADARDHQRSQRRSRGVPRPRPSSTSGAKATDTSRSGRDTPLPRLAPRPPRTAGVARGVAPPHPRVRGGPRPIARVHHGLACGRGPAFGVPPAPRDRA